MCVRRGKGWWGDSRGLLVDAHREIFNNSLFSLSWRCNCHSKMREAGCTTLKGKKTCNLLHTRKVQGEAAHLEILMRIYHLWQSSGPRAPPNSGKKKKIPICTQWGLFFDSWNCFWKAEPPSPQHTGLFQLKTISRVKQKISPGSSRTIIPLWLSRGWYQTRSREGDAKRCDVIFWDASKSLANSTVQKPLYWAVHSLPQKIL